MSSDFRIPAKVQEQLDRRVDDELGSPVGGVRDPDQATAARDEAIGRVDEHADSDVKRQALAVVATLAAEGREFTTDDVWGRMTLKPREPRMLGAVMRVAAGEGWVEPTDRTIPSERVDCHRRPVRVWRPVARHGEESQP